MLGALLGAQYDWYFPNTEPPFTTPPYVQDEVGPYLTEYEFPYILAYIKLNKKLNFVTWFTDNTWFKGDDTGFGN